MTTRTHMLEKIEAIAGFLRQVSAAESVVIDLHDRLPGGALQENWALDITLASGPASGFHQLVLRMDAAPTMPGRWSGGDEFALLQAACRADVLVPEPLWLEASGLVIGRPFYLMRRLPGVAEPHKIIPAMDDDNDGEALVHQLGRQLARLHRITIDQAPANLGFLPKPMGDFMAARFADYRTQLDCLPEPRPVLEWALAWLAANAPEIERLVLCHRDFRTGNILLAQGHLTGILDFEFAGWSDPMEDLGWFCARCWRFGANGREAGGLGPRESFYAGYAAESGCAVDDGRVRYWEKVAALRWAIIAIQQGERHLSGESPSLDLALTALRAVEAEYDLLSDISEDLRRLKNVDAA